MFCLVAVVAVSKLGCLPPSRVAYDSTPDTGRVLPPTAAIRRPRPQMLPEIPGPAITGRSWTPDAEARDWTSIVIHHTATNAGSVESIHQSHLARKDSKGNNWLGIGYHFVIGNGNGMGDGEIEPTFRWKQQMHGAHAGSTDYNQHGIGIALIGNFEEKPPTPAQLQAIKQLVADLKANYGIPASRVIGHGDGKSSEYPGRLFPLAEVSEAQRGWSYVSVPQNRQWARNRSFAGLSP